MKDPVDPGTLDLEDWLSKSRRPRAIGAYIFAGGFTLGVREHFDVACHLEESNYGVATVRRNMPELPVYYGRERWPAKLSGHEWDFIFGNPPCAAWSQAGKVVFGADWRQDARVDCTRRHFQLLEKLRPAFWVWESVPRALSAGRELCDALAQRALDLGYGVTYLLHNARYLGCAQNRPRFFFVAHRVAFDPKLPDLEEQSCGEFLRRMNDVGEIDMRLSPAHEELFQYVKPGQQLREVWEERNPSPERNALGQVRGRPPFTYHRLRADDPSNAIAGFYLIHPTENRCLTTREMAALCGFPADYEFVGSGVCNQIARGVCPPVGKWLAGEVARSLREDKVVKNSVKLINLSRPPFGESIVQLTDVSDEMIKESTTAAPVSQPAATVAPPEPAPRYTRVQAQRVQGSGAFIRELIVAGASTEEIIRKNKERFPQSRAGKSDVYWNRKKIERDVTVAPAQFVSQAPVQVVGSAPEPNDKAQETRSKIARVPRRFDTTALTEKSHGDRVHRDYAAHFFRWGWAKRQVENGHEVLDVGCGVDVPFVRMLVGAYADGVPRRYVGVDFNTLTRVPYRPWATFHGKFDFTARWRELGQFDRVVCFEVIEHMGTADGDALLAGIRGCLRDAGSRAYLSTPVFDGRAAANHVHEYTVPELAEAVRRAGLVVAERYGTFANYRDVKKVARPEHLAVLDALNRWYSTDVTACFLAPLYPDASRNCCWVLERAS